MVLRRRASRTRAPLKNCIKSLCPITLRNSQFKCVPNRIRIWIFGFQESRKEPFGAGTRINTKQIDSDPGHICGGGECSHHCAVLVSLNLWGVCSSNSLATRRGTRNLIYILLLFFLIFLQLLLTLLLLYFSYISINTLFKYSSGFNSQSWTCLG